MMKVKRFVNELMSSNCYLVVDEDSKHCICIDPASEKSICEIKYIEKNALILDYIILTHEHTDHTWGINALRRASSITKLVCSELCGKNIAIANSAYFLLYYDDPTYSYEVEPADILIKGQIERMDWCGHKIIYYFTPGHSYGSMCIEIDGMLFTGDTIMPFPPYFNGRDSNRDDWKESVRMIINVVSPGFIIYPGHGDICNVCDIIALYKDYL